MVGDGAKDQAAIRDRIKNRRGDGSAGREIQPHQCEPYRESGECRTGRRNKQRHLLADLHFFPLAVRDGCQFRNDAKGRHREIVDKGMQVVRELDLAPFVFRPAMRADRNSLARIGVEQDIVIVECAGSGEFDGNNCLRRKRMTHTSDRMVSPRQGKPHLAAIARKYISIGGATSLEVADRISARSIGANSVRHSPALTKSPVAKRAINDPPTPAFGHYRRVGPAQCASRTLLNAACGFARRRPCVKSRSVLSTICNRRLAAPYQEQ